MGFLERAIRRGVSDAVGKAIGKAIEPTVTDLTNKAANTIDQAAQNTEQQVARSSGLEGAMANLERSVQGYATEAAKNMKVCPNCNKPTTADKKFCPECGTQLPEQTVATLVMVETVTTIPAIITPTILRPVITAIWLCGLC